MNTIETYDAPELCTDLLMQQNCFIGGPTGCGKSVLMKLLIFSALEKNKKIYIIDPKGLELNEYSHCQNVFGYAQEASEIVNLLREIKSILDQRIQRIPAHTNKSNEEDLYVFFEDFFFIDYYTKSQREEIEALVHAILFLGKNTNIHTYLVNQDVLPEHIMLYIQAKVVFFSMSSKLAKCIGLKRIRAVGRNKCYYYSPDCELRICEVKQIDEAQENQLLNK